MEWSAARFSKAGKAKQSKAKRSAAKRAKQKEIIMAFHHKLSVDQRRELEEIHKRNPDGVLLPEDIVKFARNKNTALHSRFEWDNNKAAESYRIWQARTILNVYVTVRKVSQSPQKVFVSLKSDRRAGGGYRKLKAVLRNKAARAELLSQAIQELRTWCERYDCLEELTPVINVYRELAEESEEAA